MNYGLPYMGSKTKIAAKIIQALPCAEAFVDLFAGGCALTHAAIASRKFKQFILNDITDAPQVFAKAIQGEYDDEHRWISRADFFRLKDSDPYVRICWSFGNDQRTYMFSSENEVLNKAIYWAVKYRDGRPLKRLYGVELPEATLEIDGQKSRWHAIKRYCQSIGFTSEPRQRLLYCSPIERHNRVLDMNTNVGDVNLTVLQGDYQTVRIPDGAVVICDPPYRATQGYITDFSHERYYNWLRSVNSPVYTCEYDMPDDFVCISEYRRLSSLGNSQSTIEKLYVHRRWIDKIIKQTLF